MHTNMRSRETENKTRRGALVYTDIHSKSTIVLKKVLTWGFKLPCLFLAFEPVSGLMPRKHLKTISQDNNFNFT